MNSLLNSTLSFNKSINYNPFLHTISLFEQRFSRNFSSNFSESVISIKRIKKTITKSIDGLVETKNVSYHYKDGLLKHFNDGVNDVYYLYNNQNMPYGFRLETSYSTQYFYFIIDASGAIDGIVNSRGETVVVYEYSPYGGILNIINLTSINIGQMNIIAYKGYIYDEETGLYWLSSRYYDPEIERFISPDSVDYLDPTAINGLNLYAYCYNDPINYFDPSGHIATELIFGGTALYYLLAGLVILIVGTGAVIVSQTDFQNISFDVPFEWKALWNNLSDNVSNMWSDISNWWNGLYERNNTSLSTTYANYNEFTIMEYQRKTPAPRIKCKSRKEAQQKAFLKGGKRKPILHFNGPHGPHFHPDDPKFSHWHYYFGWLLWKILNGEDDEYEY